MSEHQLTMVTGRVSKELLGALKDELYGKGNHISDADSDRAQVIAESFQHIASCRGMSCRQGRVECREDCNPLPEMACAAPDDVEETAWGRMRQWLFGAFGI